MPWTWVGPGSRSGSTRVQKASTSRPSDSRTTTATSTTRSSCGENPVVSRSTTANPGRWSREGAMRDTVEGGCPVVPAGANATGPVPSSGVGADQLLELGLDVGFVLLLVLAGLGRAPPATVEPDGRDEHEHADHADPEPVLPLLG